jgi:hypothetical protein
MCYYLEPACTHKSTVRTRSMGKRTRTTVLQQENEEDRERERDQNDYLGEEVNTLQAPIVRLLFRSSFASQSS